MHTYNNHRLLNNDPTKTKEWVIGLISFVEDGTIFGLLLKYINIYKQPSTKIDIKFEKTVYMLVPRHNSVQRRLINHAQLSHNG